MHEHLMRRTLSLAERALQEGELPIAALVVLGGRVIAEASTGERREGRLLAHAELLALEAADRVCPFGESRRDAVLYTNLEPCLMCLGAAMPSYRLPTSIGGVLREASGALFQRYVDRYPDGGPLSAWASSLARRV